MWDGYQVVSPLSDSEAEAIYIQLSALVPIIQATHEVLQAKKDAFMDLLPQLLTETILRHPRNMVHDNLVAVKSSFIDMKLALIDAVPVSGSTLFAGLIGALALGISCCFCLSISVAGWDGGSGGGSRAKD